MSASECVVYITMFVHELHETVFGTATNNDKQR